MSITSAIQTLCRRYYCSVYRWILLSTLPHNLQYKLRPDNIHITHDISQQCSIFINIKLSKGPRFISSNLFDTSVYRKPIKKYVYIPQFLAHVTFISIVTSELQRYRTFCTSDSDCESVKDLFFNRLLARGNNLVDLHTWFSNIPIRSQLLYMCLSKVAPSLSDSPAQIIFKIPRMPRTTQLQLSTLLHYSPSLWTDPDFNCVPPSYSLSWNHISSLQTDFIVLPYREALVFRIVFKIIL